MVLSPKQEDFLLDSTARINASEGAVRSGKSHAADIRWLEFTQTQRGPFLLTGKTIDTIERNVVGPLMELGGNAVRWQTRGRELLIGNALVYAVGMNDAKAETRLRGMTIGGWYADEVTLAPEDAVRMALSRMSIPGAKAFWTMNPDNPYHWVLKNYLERPELLKGPNPILKRWHFNLEDNPGLDDEYKASLKDLYTGLFYQRMILGLWVLAEGVIYAQFQEKFHVVKNLPVNQRGQMAFTHYWVGVDYGTSNPCVFLLFGMDATGGIWVIREYYWDSATQRRQKTDEEYADDMLGWLGDVIPQVLYVDPSAASFIVALRKRGWIVQAAANEVMDGIRNVSTHMGAGKLHIHESCGNTIREFTAYIWDEKAQKHGEDKPLKMYDHAMDALRYGVHSHTKGAKGIVTAKPAGW